MSYFLRFHTERMIVYGESLQYVSTQKDSSVECAKGFNPEICTGTDELDHIPLKERYRILLADKSSGLATVSARKSIMCVKTGRSYIDYYRGL